MCFRRRRGGSLRLSVRCCFFCGFRSVRRRSFCLFPSFCRSCFRSACRFRVFGLSFWPLSGWRCSCRFLAVGFAAVRFLVFRRPCGRSWPVCVRFRRFSPARVAGWFLVSRLCLSFSLLPLGSCLSCFAALSFFVACGGFQPLPIITETPQNHGGEEKAGLPPLFFLCL